MSDINKMDNLGFEESDVIFNAQKQFMPKNEEDAKKKEEYIDSNIIAKLAKVGTRVRLTRDIRALYRFMKSENVSLAKKFVVIAALLYFILPIDAIPDFIPVAGFLDDIGVVAAVVAFLGKELVEFYDN